MNVRTLELDISKEGCGCCLKVGQGDVGGTTIKALIYDNGAEIDLSGSTVYLVALLPNKRNYYRQACDVEGNAATVTVDEDGLCSVSGYTDEAYFTISNDGHTYSTERFAIDIVRSALDGQKPAENWDNAIQNIIDRGESAEQKYAKAEELRNQAEQSRAKAESGRQSAESNRDEAEKSRATAEGQRTSAEKERVSAESLRVQAESLRKQAEELRVQAESARKAAEDARAEAEKLRAAAEQQRATDQAKNNADQAANNQAAQGLQVTILNTGQFDAETLEPTISGNAGKLYFVPDANADDDGNSYIEWMWINNAWERVGMSDATFVPISTSEIDKVTNGEGGSGESVLSLAGLNYFWTKIKAAAAAKFALLNHTHAAKDVTGLAASKAIVSDAGGSLASSSVSATELGYLSGASSNLQDQIDTVRDSVSQSSVSLNPNSGLKNYSSYTNSSFCSNRVVTIQACIVLSSDTAWSSSELRLFNLQEGFAPSAERNLNRCVFIISTDGSVAVRSIRVSTNGSVTFVQSGTIDKVRYVCIPGVSFLL